MKGSNGADGVRGMWTAFGPELWALRGRFALANGITLVAVAAAAIAPWPLKMIVDTLVAGPSGLASFGDFANARPEALVLGLGIIFLLVSVIGALAESGDGVVSAQIKERLGFAVRDRVVTHLQSLPPTIRMKHRSGELVLRLVGDVDQFTRLWTKTIPLLARHTATTVVTVAGIAWLSPAIGVACFVTLPVLAALVRYYGRQVARTSRAKRKREGEVSATAQEIVRGLPVIQALGATDAARHRLAGVSAMSLAAGVEASRAAARLERSFELARGGAVALVTVGGALLVLRGWLTIGELTVLSAYVAQLVRPIDKINDITEAVSRGLVAGERLSAILNERPLVIDAPDAHAIGRAAGRLELRNVSFAYPTETQKRDPVLRGVNLTCEPGTLTVLVGASGAGKTTITSLLLRLFDPAAGQVLLDGRPITEITLQSLRRQFAVMTQDLHLFSGTLRQALTGEVPLAGDVVESGETSLVNRRADAAADQRDDDDDRVWQALEFVALAEFVRALPAGLDTAIGEDGLNLSGGQRQRMSLARAFLLDRPIIVLDEPLANVDAVSARVILGALDRLRTHRTCLAITHESALLSAADVVYRLSNGTVRRERHRAPVAVSGLSASASIVVGAAR